MDPLTHCLLGAAAAQAAVGKRLGRMALLLGAIGGEIPDIDVVIPADPALPMEWHRHFTHSLVCAPLMGALAALPFMIAARWRRQWTLVFAAAISGAVTHGVLDTCTTYGTYWLWPLVDRRLGWDVISIIDPIFTVILIAGVAWAGIAARAGPARAAAGLCLLYLGLGTLQHHRATSLQHELAAQRGHSIVHGNAMPTFANLIVWRSVYASAGALHADSLRLGWPGKARALAGASIPVATAQDLPYRAADDARVATAFDGLRAFANGYVAFLPADHEIVGDMRYSLSPGGFEPIWGIKIELAGTRPMVTWVFLGGDRRAALRNVWTDLTDSQ